MEGQDTKFNYKIVFAALGAVIFGILIAFYYSYAQSRSQISYLEEQKDLLVKDLTLMKADLDRLTARDEVSTIEIQNAKYEVQELRDSIGRLNFTVDKLRDYKTELRRLEARNDSLKLKNDYLKYNNSRLASKSRETKKQMEVLRSKSSSLAAAEALQRKTIQELNRELKIKSYLKIQGSQGSGFRVRNGKPIQTNKASLIERLRGTAIIVKDPTAAGTEKIVYFQFLGPNMRIIEDNANTITVNGNIYSKRVEFLFNGEQTQVNDYITLPEGSLEPGTYTLNVFEDERLLSSSEFLLK
ncbi:hypothetical protein [Maribacter sp. 2-571]|uniref:hypothetical protein n=1 Tax=Maribacter sp. 2-571 TaxID=3417569 RepID=UPI003D32F223